ncbi:hypothetical protein MES5069_450054 [Mesorhizobium escarrei]|uniref:Transposase n=1 Tax=Mesorhizobium escarrei TaxID=666018 RepID=A0ABN8K689_9HYPH|nr:hypothetical protein MES5069_450054 [Mesorhizobium escarrei]
MRRAINSVRRPRIEGTANVQARERRETGEQALFRSGLDLIITIKHKLVWLEQAIDWPVLEERFGAVYSGGPWHATTADPADGGACNTQAHFQPARLGAVRARW